MRLIVNGEARHAAADTLAALLAEMQFEGAWLATAVNGSVVRAADRSSCLLNEGDRVEILSPRQGG